MRSYENLIEFMKHLFPFQPCRFAMGSKTSLKLLPNLKEGVILFVEVPLSLCRCRTSRSLCSELGDVPTLCPKDSGEKNAHVLGWGQCYKHTHTNALKFDRLYRLYVHIIEGSLEVKLPTIWTDEKQRWEESEKRREEETISKKRKSQKKEDPGARKGTVGKSRNTVFFQ